MSVYTQNAEDCQWGVFDFQNINIDTITGQLDDLDDSKDQKTNYETCKFQLKGCNFITRQSKYKMTQCLPSESSEGQISMGSLSVIQHADMYQIYQISDLNMDFSTQVKLQDDFISQQLKDLSKKSYIFASSNNEVGTFRAGMNKKAKEVKRGCIIRAGDIIKFGRVPVMIKESSIDTKKWKEIEKFKK